jgi:hypothetical protein
MPLLIWVAIRIVRALTATLRLLADWRTLRRLPWSYLRGLPRRDRWVGVLVVTLAVSTVGLLVGAAAPAATVRHAALALATSVAFAGVVSTWIRAIARR